VCRQRVPNGWRCNLEAPSTEFSSGTKDQHVAAFGGTEMRPTRDVGNRRGNVPEVCRASATDTVEGGSSLPCIVSVEGLAASGAHRTCYKDDLSFLWETWELPCAF